MSDFEISKCADAGAFVERNGVVDFTVGLIAGNPVGLDLPAGYDLRWVSRSIVYQDNQKNLVLRSP